MAKKLKKQYRKIQEDWAYIRRYNDTTRCLSKSAQDILFSALYQINKYGHAVLTHHELSKLTNAKANQNCNLVKQIGFVLDFEFKRSIIINDKKYRDCYIFTKNKNTDEILDNPKKFFKKNMVKNCETSHKKTTKDLTKNCETSHKKLCHHSQKIVRSPESLHIYTKNKDKINDNKDNQNQFNNSNLVSSNSENVKRLDSKIETTESVEKSEKLLAKEKSIGNLNSNLISKFPFGDNLILEAISKSEKPDFNLEEVKRILFDIINNSPTKKLYGGRQGLIKYITKVINGEKDYKKDKAESIAQRIEKRKKLESKRSNQSNKFQSIEGYYKYGK